MKLTPLDIRHREFKRGMRGYADVEVDEFLDQVADEYERLFKENIDLTERLESVQEKVTQYKRIEETLQKTLVSAQASAEELKQNATKEAQLILRDAELKARQMVNDTYTEKQAIEQSMAKLRAAEQDFAFKFRQLLQGYLQQLDEAAEAPPETEERAAEFDRQAQAIKEAIAREAAAVPADATRAVSPAATASGPVDAEAASGDLAPQSPPAAADEPLDEPEPAVEQTAEITTERAAISDDDDLMADVDGGVNENEFRW
jgi:cell division initiation protein